MGKIFYVRKWEKKNKKEKTMGQEINLLDSLNKIISVQNELIGFLKAEVERLKTSQITINPVPSAPTGPVNPYPYPYHPVNPYISDTRTPWTQPINPPFTITSVDDPSKTTGPDTTVITGSPLPIGPQQFATPQFSHICNHEMIVSGDAKSGGEKCIKCGYGLGWANSTPIAGLTIT